MRGSDMKWIEEMNALGQKKTPFLFVLDFELQKPFICKISEIQDNIFYEFPSHKKTAPFLTPKTQLQFQAESISPQRFEQAFREVVLQQLQGNSYLLNLTFPSTVHTNYTLSEIYATAKAKYKLYFRDECIVFSPETFITIAGNTIRTYPMKGTINANLPEAQDRILSDAKETAEHNTIVDLMRNDLSRVATHVSMTKYRFIDRIESRQGALLQVSSEITGTLTPHFANHLGDVFASLLPAGSISGAPKEKTSAIIREVESGPRGYYTGICGIFDGKNVDSAVMIRFIEQQNGNLLYRSGGGITVYSDLASEYRELIDKVYVPIG
jgi:para-aminobenzoate synthetase component 1